MIQVTIGNNLKRTKVVIDENTTVRKALEDNDIDYSNGATHLDGATLQPGDMDKSFATFGIAEKCTLTVVVKADGASK